MLPRSTALTESAVILREISSLRKMIEKLERGMQVSKGEPEKKKKDHAGKDEDFVDTK